MTLRSMSKTRAILGPLALGLNLGLVVGASQPCAAQQSPEVQQGEARQSQTEQLAEADDSQIQSWIDSLASPEFDRREQALRNLVESGSRAIELLERNQNTPNLEARLRIVDALSQIRQQEMEKRLGRLIEGVDGEELGLPLWKSWIDAVGDSEDSRTLYAEMARAEWGFLNFAMTAEERAVKVRLQDGFEMVRRGTKVTSVATFTALIFVGSLYETVDDQTMLGINNCRQIEAIKRAIERGRYSASMRTLLERSLSKVSLTYIPIMLGMAIDLELECGRVKAREIIQRAETFPERHLQAAMITLARLGSKSDVNLVETMFDDTRSFQLIVDNRAMATELRVYALAVALVLTEQKLSDYKINSDVADPDQWHIYLGLWFATAEDRDEAFGRWERDRESLLNE